MSNDPRTPPQRDPHAAPGAPAAHDHESAPDHPAFSGRATSIALIVVLIAVVCLGGYGIWKRHHNDSVLADTTRQSAAPSVIALPPQSGSPVDSFVLPGNVSAYNDSPIYARTSGYLTHWYYDIGAKVKKGDLLAEISSPEVDQQLAQAQADLITAQTNAGNAKTQSDRYTELVKSDAVSRIDTETFQTQAASTSSAVKSSQANVQRLKELAGFEKIYAPFDGVVTARGVDIGTLINEGASNELFHVQSIRTLRVYTNVPQVYVPAIKRGQKIDLTFPEHPGKTFQGAVVRTADSIDPSSRTLLVEVDVDNRNGELMPGSLAQVHFKSPAYTQTFVVPASALIFRREGLRVGTIVNENIAHLIPITIGQDDGATVQVVAGLNANDRVIQDPPDSIIEGEQLYVEAGPQQSPEKTAGPSTTQGGAH